MKQRFRKFLLLCAAAAIFVPASLVTATSTNIQAKARFLAAIQLTPSDMQFGNVTFGAAPGAGDTATLSTDGSISYVGTFTGGGGTVAAGNVAISATPGQTMDVSCNATGVLAQDAGPGRITINDVRVANESAAAGGGSTCAGIGTVVLSFTLASSSDDQIKVGGRIDGATQVAFAAGDYATTNAGGSNILVDVIYQ